MADVVAFLIIKRESERVPGKNFRDLGGRPLYRWILDALIATPVTRIRIDTDARDRLEELGLPDDPRIEVVDRAPALRGHVVTANALIAAHIDAFPGATWLMTHATSPFVSATTLTGALVELARLAATGEGDSVFGATRHQARFYDEAGTALNHDPARLLSTQELTPWLEENSALYAFTEQSFRRTRSRLGATPKPFPVPRLEALDIDTEDDFHLASVVAAGLRTG